MKTFKNLKTGVLEHVTNEKLISQYEKYTDVYELVEDTKADKEPTLNELKAKADELGIEYAKKVTKAELLELISAKENN